MTVCIECSSSVPDEMRSKLYCPFCSKKIDKYTEVNNTYTIIDLLLLKESVFRHLFLNSPFSRWDFAILIFVHLCSIASIKISNLRISPLIIHADRLVEIDFHYSSIHIQLLSIFIYFACLRVVFNKIKFQVFLYALLLSSFYNNIKIVFSMWNYNVIQYFIIIEILSCCGNIFALICIDNDFSKVFSTVLIAKVISIVIPLSIANVSAL